jgi:hypothetical protein
MNFPNGRRFAFTILDDTDDATFENIVPVYDRLREYGFRTTKTVWPLDCPEGSQEYFAAETLQRPEYLSYVQQLVADGFELASHGATMESSDRERTLRGLEFLDRHFDTTLQLYANHGENREDVYWGAERFRTPLLRWLVRTIERNRRDGYYCGEVEGSPFFWGDECRKRFRYVRNFTFSSLDALSFNPEMPYSTSSTPYVEHWFSTTDVPDIETFQRRGTRDAIDRLEADAGVCILSTHFGKRGYLANGRLDPDVDEMLRYIAAKPGWFVPVSELLDHLRAQQTGRNLEGFALARLEVRFLIDRLFDRLRSRG